MNTIMISGGNINSDFALDFLKRHSGDCIIAVDKGLLFCHQQGIRPDYIVGDFDSVPREVIGNYETKGGIPVRRLKPEKDDSDTESALHLAMDLGAENVFLLGATGTRLDHMLANLQLLAYARERGIAMYLLDEYNCVAVLDKGIWIEKERQYGEYVSFFSLGDKVTELTLRGFKYPLSQYCLTNRSCGLGLSNEILSPVANVSFAKGLLVMVMSKD